MMRREGGAPAASIFIGTIIRIQIGGGWVPACWECLERAKHRDRAVSLAQVLSYALAVYVAAGLCVAAAFVSFGVTHVLPHAGSSPMSFTLGARLLLFPGAAALWPYVLLRWLRAGHHP
jgi:hypothetical protein